MALDENNNYSQQAPRRKKTWLPFAIIGGILFTILIVVLPLIYIIWYMNS